MSYERLLSLQSLRDVPSPWRGLTLNRCLVLALLLVLVSSGVNEVNEALGTVLEQTGLLGGGDLEEGVAAQPAKPLWEAVVGWVWGDEEDEEAARMKKKQRLGGTMRLRNKEAIRSGLLKQEERGGL